MSFDAPGGYGTTSRTARAGKSPAFCWACAGAPGSIMQSSTVATADVTLMFPSPVCVHDVSSGTGNSDPVIAPGVT